MYFRTPDKKQTILFDSHKNNSFLKKIYHVLLVTAFYKKKKLCIDKNYLKKIVIDNLLTNEKIL